MNGRGAEREGDTESEAGSRLRAISPEPDAGARTHRPRDRDLAEVGRLTDCATQAPQHLLIFERERQSMNGGGSEREGDTECETASRL